MTKTKLIVLLAFVVVFGAGAVVGMVERHAGPPKRGPSWLRDQLNLTPEQQTQMKEIWEPMGPPGRGRSEHDHSRRELQKERDDEIRAALSDDDKAKFDAVAKKYEEKLADLSKEREKNFQDAVERTKKILNPAQRAKYDEIIKSWHDNGRRPGGPGREVGRADPRATTNPS